MYLWWICTLVSCILYKDCRRDCIVICNFLKKLLCYIHYSKIKTSLGMEILNNGRGGGCPVRKPPHVYMCQIWYNFRFCCPNVELKLFQEFCQSPENDAYCSMTSMLPSVFMIQNICSVIRIKMSLKQLCKSVHASPWLSTNLCKFWLQKIALES